MSTSLNAAVETISSISSNPYALSAIFNVLPEQFSGTTGNLDDQIERFNAMLSAMEELSGIAKLAESKQEFSDGLPEFKRGAEANRDLNTLVYSLAVAVRDAISEAIIEESGGASFDSDAETTNAKIAPFLAELLEIGGIRLTAKAVHNRLASASR